jgi:hypothetical protein
MGQMNAMAELDECRDEISGERYPPRVRVGKSNSGGGGMDDILKRLGAVEATVSEIRTQVGAIAAILPHLATKSDVNAIENATIKWTIATIIATAGLTIAIARFIH